jgi:PIN domain nuclease of toxin-antitoxin system
VRLLLDTHIWLWSEGVVSKLAAHVAKELDDPANEKWISPISIWELLVLLEKRRITLTEDVESWVTKSLRDSGLKEAPLTMEVVLATRGIRLPHRDPADLFLAATAKVFDLTLVTADIRLLDVPGLSTLANR